MKKFVFKTFLFFLPFLLVLAVELFVLPLDYFTFRVWEALVVRKNNFILRGPFYPDRDITKIEEGDLAHHTRFIHKRKARWATDHYGYRKSNTLTPGYKIVIIGDSNIAGCGVTQEDMLSEVLEDRLKVEVYPLAPGFIGTFLKEKRFADYPPDVVIIASAERFITYLPPVKLKKEKRQNPFWPEIIQWIKDKRVILRYHLQTNRWIQSIAIYRDRLRKNNMLNYLRASIRRRVLSQSESIPTPNVPSKHGLVVFLQGAAGNDDVPPDKLEKAIQVIKGYNDVLHEKGIRFIFLPIPEKENIYYKELGTKKPVFLEKLISGLKERGVETIDTQKPFEEAFKKDILLYHTNDTHWNENAVRITAELIVELLRKKGK